MSRTQWALSIAALVTCPLGCAAGDSAVEGVLPGREAGAPGNPPAAGLPTGPPLEMFDAATWGPMDSGSSQDSGGARPDAGGGLVGGADGGRSDSAVPGTDGGFVPPDPGGPINMAPV